MFQRKAIVPYERIIKSNNLVLTDTGNGIGESIVDGLFHGHMYASMLGAGYEAVRWNRIRRKGHRHFGVAGNNQENLHGNVVVTGRIEIDGFHTATTGVTTRG